MPPNLTLKPHHFVDIIRSFGCGQKTFEPHPYGHAVCTVSEAILSNPETALTIELGADSICHPCVHNIDGVCDDTINTSNRPKAPKSKQAYNLLIDQRWSQRLGITQGDRFTARELCRLIHDKMGDTTDIYHEMPADLVAKRRENLVNGLEYYLAKER